MIDIRNDKINMNTSSIVISPMGNYIIFRITNNLELQITPDQYLEICKAFR